MNAFDDTDSAQSYGRTVLHGQKVRLRPLLESDLAELEAWWADPEWAILQQDRIMPRPAGTMTEIFRHWSQNDSPAGAGFAVAPLDGDRFLGHVTLWGASMPTRIATAAIIMGPQHTGRGYGTDALRVLIRYGFQELAVNKIEINAWAFNTRALATYRKLGFTQEGVRRAAAYFGGQYHDEVRMGMLKSEWQQ